MLCSEGSPENTESPDSHDIPEVVVFLSFGLFPFRGDLVLWSFFHTLISEFPLKKVFCEASQNCFVMSSAITSLSGACEALAIKKVKEVLPENNLIACDKNLFKHLLSWCDYVGRFSPVKHTLLMVLGDFCP